MQKLQPVRGTHDILPDVMARHRRVAETARDLAALYGFEQIETPIFEFTEVFKRTLGDTSDIVTKEMYTFQDRSGDMLTLRPEGTAGVARMVITEGLTQSLPLKYFYTGPMFRHERPQKGRLRQFHQVGVELLGAAGPQGDIEVLALAHHFLDALGIGDKTTLEINTLGDAESRVNYRDVLVKYLEGFRDQLSEDSRERLDRNPLRVLDTKIEHEKLIVADAPLFSDYLTDAARKFFGDVRGGLDRLGIPYKINPRLVRGLDYYCHTAFEFTTDALGAQGTVLAGGRYDGLIETMGGSSTPGVGWAAGIERLSMLASEPVSAQRPIAVVPLGAAAEAEALTLTAQLRHAGIATDLGYSGNLARRMKRADRIKARFAVIIGDDELAKGVATVRDLDSGAQESVPLATLVERFRSKE